MSARVQPRGYALLGRVRPGGRADEVADGVLVVDGDGRVAALGPAALVDLPPDLPRVGGPGGVVMPGVVDAHVHLAFAPDPAALLAGGVVAVRDLGAPPGLVSSWRRARRTPGAPIVAAAGPLLTAPGGYPSRSWGAGGFAVPVADPTQARRSVAAVAGDGADVVKLALEPAAGQPVPDLPTARAVVAAAHQCGLAVTCHALSAPMVARALAAGVDELCHVPVEPLPEPLVERLAGSGIAVVSTLHTHATAAGAGTRRTGAPERTAPVVTTARALVRAGVRLVYGTDLGNAGTVPGADPRELELLVAAGLTARQALAAATEGAAGVAGLAGRDLGGLAVGRAAHALVLAGDPLADFMLLRRPVAVVVDGRLVGGSAWAT